MLDLNVLDQVKKNPKLCKCISQEDLLQAWDAVCKEIRTNLLRCRGTTIKDVGTFTVSQWRINLSGAKFIPVKSPVFALSRRLAQAFDVRALTRYVPAKVSTRMLTAEAVCSVTRLPRNVVERGLKEVAIALATALSSRAPLHLPFPKLGRLVVANGNAVMRFDADFLEEFNTEHKEPAPIPSHLKLPKVPKTKGILQPLPARCQRERPVTPKRCVCSGQKPPSVRSESPAVVAVASARSVPHSERAPSRASSVASGPRQGTPVSHTPPVSKHASPPASPARSEDEKQDRLSVVDVVPPPPKGADPELCYLCQLQKLRETKAANTTVGSKEADMAKEKLVILDMLRRDAEAVMEDMRKEDNRRKRNRDLALYNKHLGEQQRLDFVENKRCDFYAEPQSYVLVGRPSSARDEKGFFGDILRQAEEEEARKRREAEEQERQDRRRQMELARTTEEQRWADAMRLKQQKDLYRKELQAQMDFKKEYWKQFSHDNHVETTDLLGMPFHNRRADEDRRKALELVQFNDYQKERKLVRDRKWREDKLAYERNWLEELRRQACDERQRLAERARRERAEMLAAWKCQADRKRKFDQVERDFLARPAGNLFCHLADRCKRCKRRLGYPSLRFSD